MLAFHFTIMDSEGPEEIEESPADGVYIYGLYIDGARWDRKTEMIAD
jgi:dynein heavy chain